MLWIDVDESIPNLPFFFINFRVHMTSLVDGDKVVVKRNAFLALPIAWNEGELEDEEKKWKVGAPK